MTASEPRPTEPERRGTILLSANTCWNIFNFRMGFVRRLQAEGYRVSVAAPDDDYSARLREAGCDVHPVLVNSKNTSPIQDLGLFWRYLKLVRRVRPVAYLGFTAKPNIYGSLAAQLCGVPTINNISGLGTAFIRRNWITAVVRNLYRVGLLRASTVFFQNRDDLELFVTERLVRRKAAALLPGSGVDLARFDAVPLPNGDGFSFLMIGRLLRDKGVVEYVKAARQVKARHPDSRFGLLGFLDVDNLTAISRAEVDGWQAEGLITYLGVTDDVRPFIADAHCVVLPSYREGTPKTLLEAAAMARPLIATDVPGCREAIEAGRNGFLCDVRSADSLATQMLAMIDTPASQLKQMADASRDMVERRFDERIVHDLNLDAIRRATAQ